MTVVEQEARLELKVITPVHVWSGEDLALNLDYCYSNGRVYLLDFFNIDEDYRRRVLENRPVICPPRRGVVEVLEANTDISKFKSIKKHVRIGGVRLIPGSTIKGLIRTAFLYYVFKNNRREYNRIVNEIRDKLISIAQSHVRAARRIAKEVAVPVEAYVKEPINSFSIDAFSRLVVSDPLNSNVKSSVYLAEVYELTGNSINLKVTSPLEVLEPGSTIEYNVRVIKRMDFKVAYGRILGKIRDIVNKYSLIDLDVLRKSLREFSADTIDYELKRVSRIPQLRDYASMLSEFKSRISDNVFYVRVGYMSGHVFKTIDLALDDYTAKLLKDSMSSLVDRSTRGRISVWDDITVKLTRVNNKLLGIGWVELKLT